MVRCLGVRRCRPWLQSHTSSLSTVTCLPFDGDKNNSGRKIPAEVFLQDYFETSVFSVLSNRWWYLRPTGAVLSIEILFTMSLLSVIKMWSRTSRTLKGPFVRGVGLSNLAEFCRSAANMVNSCRFT